MAVIPPATGIWHFLEGVDELGENRYLGDKSCGLRLGIISMVWTRRQRERVLFC